MNTVLWALQAILSIKLLTTAFSHGLRHGQEKMAQGIQRMGPTGRPILTATSLILLLGSLSLVAPVVLDVPHWLAPAAAALLAGMMLLSILLHVSCREQANVFVSVVLFAMAAFVAYGRWALKPF